MRKRVGSRARPRLGPGLAVVGALGSEPRVLCTVFHPYPSGRVPSAHLPPPVAPQPRLCLRLLPPDCFLGLRHRPQGSASESPLNAYAGTPALPPPSSLASLLPAPGSRLHSLLLPSLCDEDEAQGARLGPRFPRRPPRPVPSCPVTCPVTCPDFPFLSRPPAVFCCWTAALSAERQPESEVQTSVLSLRSSRRIGASLPQRQWGR